MWWQERRLETGLVWLLHSIYYEPDVLVLKLRVGLLKLLSLEMASFPGLSK